MKRSMTPEKQTRRVELLLYKPNKEFYQEYAIENYKILRAEYRYDKKQRLFDRIENVVAARLMVDMYQVEHDYRLQCHNDADYESFGRDVVDSIDWSNYEEVGDVCCLCGRGEESEQWEDWMNPNERHA